MEPLTGLILMFLVAAGFGGAVAWIQQHQIQRLRLKLAWSGVECVCGYSLAGNTTGQCPECGRRWFEDNLDVQRLTICSFCGKSSAQTGVQAEGPGRVYICAPCVELCHAKIPTDPERSGFDWDRPAQPDATA